MGKELTRAVVTTFIVAGLVEGCGPQQIPADINQSSAKELDMYEGTAIADLAIVQRTCTESVPGYLYGTERLVQFRGSDGKVAAWTMCNGDGGSYVVQFRKEGNTPINVNKKLNYGTGVMDNQGVTELGYVDDNGASHPVYIKTSGEGAYILDYEGNEVAVKSDGNSAMDRFMNSVYSEAHAAGLPTTEAPMTPIEPVSDFTPLPSDTPIAQNTKESPAATPVPPETDRFSADILKQVPTSSKEMGGLVKVEANPFNDKAKFTEDVNAILKTINDKVLPTYTGGFLTTGNNEVGVGNETKQFIIYVTMPVIGSFTYNAGGKIDGLGLVVPMKDATHVFYGVLLVDPEGKNIDAEGSGRRTLDDVLQMLQQGNRTIVPDTANKMSTATFCGKPGAPLDKFVTADQKKFFDQYSSPCDSLLKWVTGGTNTFKDTGSINFLEYFQSVDYNRMKK